MGLDQRRVRLGLASLIGLAASCYGSTALANQHCDFPELGISRQPVLGPFVSGKPLDEALLNDAATSNARREGYQQYREFAVEPLVDSDNARKLYCYQPRREDGYVLWIRPGCAAVVIVDRRAGDIDRLIRDCAAALHGMQAITPGARLAHAVEQQFGSPLQSRQQIPDDQAELIPDYLSAMPGLEDRESR